MSMKISVLCFAVAFLAGTALAQTGISNEQDYQLAKLNGSLPSNDVIIANAPNDTIFPKVKPISSVKGGSSLCDCWIPVDPSYTLIDNNADWNATGFNSADDGSHGPVALPFTFNLYGQSFTQAFINTNGNVTFDVAFTTFTSTGFPTNVAVMVAPFWADIDLNAAFPGLNEVYYKVTPTALIVNWVNVGYYSSHTDKLNSFQLIITDGNDPIIGAGKNVSFCYGDMQWTTGDVTGSGGFGGTAASVGANHGNGVDFIQFGRFDQTGAAYDGPFNLNDGVDWLDGKNFVFTTNVSTNNIPPIASSTFLCDTLIVCVGELSQIPMDFIAPEPTQVVVATSVSAGLSNYTEITNTSPNINASILGQFTPLPSEVGFQSITFSGTDNGIPALTATYDIIVQVLPASQSVTTSLDLCTTDPLTDLLTALPGLSAGGTWIDPSGTAFGGIFDPAIDVPGTYLYSDSSSTSCPSTGTLTVAVIAAADAGVGSVLSYCTSDPTIALLSLLTGTPQMGGSWNDPSGSPMSGVLDPAIDPSGDYCYIVPGTSPCGNDTSCLTITILQVPDAGQSATLDLCADAQPVDLFTILGGTPGVGGVWIDPSLTVSSGTFLAASNPVGVYTYVILGSASCPPDSATVTVSVDPVPNAGSDVMLALCRDAALNTMFNLIAPADAGGAWLDPYNVSHTGTLDPATDSSGIYLYLVTGVGQCSALSDSAEVDVTLSEVPIVSFIVDSIASCVPFPVSFTNTTDPVFLNGNCDWDFGDGGSSQSCAGITYTYSTAGVYDVTLTVTTAAGCVGTLVRQSLIEVDEKPSADFVITPNPTTIDHPEVEMIATSPVPNQWDWNVANIASFSGSPTIQYTFPNSEGGHYEICLDVEDQYGCTDTACKTLVVLDPLLVFVPNAFTMNGDGINEGFIPVISGNDPEVHELYIFDRWGSLMFESNNGYTPWLGSKNNSGTLLPSGVYVWRLITKGYGETERKEFIGHVTLLH